MAPALPPPFRPASPAFSVTAFLATDESFAHDYHKRIVESDGSDTVLTDAFVLNWPKGAAVRVLQNSVTAVLGDQLTGHDP